jgi:hypothetical protein
MGPSPLKRQPEKKYYFMPNLVANSDDLPMSIETYPEISLVNGM